MKLTVYKKNEEIQQIHLESGKTYTVGRKQDCDILLEKLPGISRKHFEISEQQPGLWRVQVHSKVMLIEHQEEDKDDFTIMDSGEFLLRPYLFKYEASDVSALQSDQGASALSEDSPMPRDLSHMAGHSEDDEALPDADFDGNDEQTAVQNFSGTPYIKIIGQNGKKSEHFRLEGNLWIVGGQEDASIYLKDPSAADNHFELSRTDKGFFIIDSGSSLGTELNGQKLVANKPTRLQSGDLITVGETTLQFELRDQAFQRKISNIPLNMYKSPLVFFDQEVAMVTLEEPEDAVGVAEPVSQDLFSDPKKKKKFILAAVATLLVFAVIAKEFMDAANKEDEKEMASADPFQQLSPAEQKMVVQTHRLAKQLYLDGNFELALVQLEKLHSIIPSYKDSQEMEEYCINSREIRRQKAEIEQQRREQERMQQQVQSLLAQCHNRYKKSEDIEGVRACLAPAVDLDPNNPGINQLISEVTARQEESQIRAKLAREQEDKIRRGREIFQRAQALHRKQKFHEAMEAYENHIHSGLPDPSGLVSTSKRELATIEKKINTEKNQLLSSAQSKYSGTNLKQAIELARQAQRVDPFDPQISAFIHKAERELTGKMRNIYMDSVIEERFGNLEASRLKWEDIMNQDVSTGEYYRKSRRKLRQYGYLD